jgi:HEAT repeat protein
MPKKLTLEEHLSHLHALKSSPLTPDVTAELKKSLSDPTHLVVARAAALIAHFNLPALEPDLIKSFDRLMTDPAKRDKGCTGKLALAQALDHLQSRNTDVFLKGLHHTQPEPVWGGQTDTAGPLRAACALALTRLGHSRALQEIAELLADPDADVRLNIARAVAATGHDGAEAVLRLKARQGDPEPPVTGECLAALARTFPTTALPFVASFLDTPDLRDLAALALGESRHPAALALLKEKIDATLIADHRAPYLTAIGLLRLQSAVNYLLEQIESADAHTAALAVAALKPHRHDDRVAQRVRALATDREHRAISEAVAAAFG